MALNNNEFEVDSGNRFVIEDKESGSVGMMPIIVDKGYNALVVKVDGGVLRNKLDKEQACDYMLINTYDPDDSVAVDFDKVVCMIELKGTHNEKEITHAYNQIRQSIVRLSVDYPNETDYLKETDYLVAAVAGAQDKTLPSMINQEKRNLCKVLFSKSRRKVGDMNKLVFYVQPNGKTKKAYINSSKIPHVVECHSRKDAEIPVPSMIVEAVQ